MASIKMSGKSQEQKMMNPTKHFYAFQYLSNYREFTDLI